MTKNFNSKFDGMVFDRRTLPKVIEELNSYPIGKRKLDIGCRRMRAGKGCVAVDVTPPGWVKLFPNRFVHAAGDNLPFEDSYFGTVSASHCFEHFDKNSREAALLEWVRVLAVGGNLKIKVPNQKFYCELLVTGKWDCVVFANNTYGLQDSPGEYHYYCYDEKSLPEFLLKTIGKKRIRIDSVVFGHRAQWPYPNMELRLIATKLN